MKQAVVNGVAISQEAVQFEFDRLLKFYIQHGVKEDELRRRSADLAERAQEQAIGAKLLFERASQLDLQVSSAAVDVQVNQVIQQIGGHDKFMKALAAQKLSLDDFRKELERGCKVDMLVQQAVSGVGEPEESEIAAYYEAHAADYETGDEVLAQHILVKVDNMGDAAAEKLAMDKIASIKERIAAGADFSDEAKVNSDCPSGKEGGSLGWFGKGMMVPEFEKAAFGMKVGEVSDVIKTQFGFHIIYKTDERKGGKKGLVEVADSIRELLRHEARGKALDAFVAELREKADIQYRDWPEHTHGDGCSCGHNH